VVVVARTLSIPAVVAVGALVRSVQPLHCKTVARVVPDQVVPLQVALSLGAVVVVAVQV